ncbi:13679_t:CDS:2, partial [Cetraspora pellucida]
AEIAKVDGVREAINIKINQLVNGKGFVVVGCDVTTKILSDAEIKIVLSTDIKTQLYDLIQKAKQISTIIDMKNLSLDQVIPKILKIVIYHSLQYISSPIKAPYKSVVQFQDQLNEDNQISIHENTNASKRFRQKSFELAFPDLDECLEFMKNLFCYYEVIEKEYDDIDKIIPLDRNYAFYFKMQDWKSKVLSGPLNGANLSLYKDTLKKMKKIGFSVDILLTQVRSEMEIYINLLNDSKDSINYYNKWQVVGDDKNSNESYIDCAIHEAKEEVEVDIKLENLTIISTIKGFQVFPDFERQQILYLDLKKLSKYNMTNFIKEHMSMISEVINKKFCAIHNTEIDEKVTDESSSKDENIESSSN